ncbi:molybdopterin-dependent oxidoreductase-like protein [Krasilnikovia cinnamomea]|uniref:Molybdopterin-dependent oxidoreductase-like protein n=1 Tax=Krasilnikovia cinnamomea TaxID=349313 RepID=A0A4Q7ZT08_9ACTN|nr:molybdopterin-dependent oxidoreductase [Krasilnikovia cinnamomea]RZU53645.1 molybdopterin-dependent oxidoreductase-like protein [Krasilnikovia cinnamomea]
MVRHPDPALNSSRTVLRRLARWWLAPLPAPPATLRRGPLRPGAFSSPLRSARLTSQLGVALGVAFGVCFLTGLLSHLIQHPPGWFVWPAHPVWIYQLTQGIHVATGLASVPLLGVKLWSVYPRLFTWPPVRSLAHAAERASVAVLVAAALFQLVGGVLNISRWYAPMPFFFTTGHYWVGWLTVGALLAHIGVQLPVVTSALGRPAPDPPPAVPPPAVPPPAVPPPAVPPPAVPTPAPSPVGPSRRGLLTATAAAAGLITVTTVGQTLRPLSGLALLAPRRPDAGPQSLPVNKTADGAGVRAAALDPSYRLLVAGPGGRLSLDLAALNALPHHTAHLPIACVEGWSATGTWTGVRLRDLVALVGADPGRATVLVESLQAAGRYRASTVAPQLTGDPSTLIALRLGGEPLHVDHGYPARLIAPNRPGVLQTKWIGRITVGGPR